MSESDRCAHDPCSASRVLVRHIRPAFSRATRQLSRARQRRVLDVDRAHPEVGPVPARVLRARVRDGHVHRDHDVRGALPPPVGDGEVRARVCVAAGRALTFGC
jgi:hypothetical protein